MSKKHKLISIIASILFIIFILFYFLGINYTEVLVERNAEKTKNSMMKQKKDEIKKEVEILHKTISSYYLTKKLKTKKSEELQVEKQELLNYVKSLSSKEIGYYWVTDLKTNVIAHPSLENVELKKILSQKSIPYILKIYEKLLKTKEENIKYTFKNAEGKEIEKIGSIKLFEPFQWVIGKSIDKNKIEKDIEILKEDIYNNIHQFLGILLLVLIISVVVISFIIAAITERSIFKSIDNDISVLNTSLKVKNEELIKQLYLDELTGLENLTSLKKDLRKLEFASILLIDIDSFDNINKLYGYNTGDKILSSYANILEEFAKNNQYKAYRIYSNTFAFLGLKENFKVEVYYKDILNLINEENKIKISDLNISLDVNIGVCLYQDKPLIKANMALSQSKKLNKRYYIYNETIEDKQSIEKLNIIRKDITTAIETDNIIPYFQPIVNREKKIEKYEILIRLRKISNGKEEIISPYFFLDISVKTKQYKELSKIIMTKAFKFAKKEKCNLSINISLSDILDREVLDLLDFYLNIDNIPLCKLITFEILENENIQDIEVINEFVTKYRKLGIKFAIDDFGTGYSNFLNILTIKPDYIKIDGSLIKNINTDKNCYELVKSILSFSKELKISTIVEYVHNEEVFNTTMNLGVDMFQGYFFSEPRREIKL